MRQRKDMRDLNMADGVNGRFGELDARPTTSDKRPCAFGTRPVLDPSAFPYGAEP
jgi:hypothetical protein